jgi:hypothetical protein
MGKKKQKKKKREIILMSHIFGKRIIWRMSVSWEFGTKSEWEERINQMTNCSISKLVMQTF